MPTPILDIRHLEKEFVLQILNHKHIKALSDINLLIYPGEIIGLVGKSGSGKSTLMKCIYRSYLSSSGQIWYSSEQLGPIDLASAGDQEILRLRKLEITYCSQFLSVIPRVSALEVVAAGLYGRRQEEGESPLDTARKYLERVELPAELWDAYPSTFSGGEQQRVNVARAIISRPRLLLMDEPTASLDQKTKDRVIDMILELKQQGSAVLVISHDKYTLDRMCDRLVELHHGTLIEQPLSA